MMMFVKNPFSILVFGVPAQGKIGNMCSIVTRELLSSESRQKRIKQDNKKAKIQHPSRNIAEMISTFIFCSVQKVFIATLHNIRQWLRYDLDPLL